MPQIIKNAKLLCEFVDFKDLQLLTEEVEGVKNYRIKGPFIRSEIKNGNGRTYPKKYVEREVNLFTEQKIKPRRALMELDHAQNTTVHLERAAGLIESLIMEGNDAIGTAKILTGTPMGRIAKTLIDENILLGVSSRSVGGLDNNGFVDSNMHFITEDFVHDPSAPDGFVEALVEHKEYIIGDDGNILEAKYDKLESDIAKKYNSKVALEVISEFLNQFTKRI